MTDERAVDGLVAETVAAHGRLDIMICNAGGSASTTYPPHASVAEFVETFGPGPPGAVKSVLIVSHSKYVSYGAFVWAPSRPLNCPKRRFPAPPRADMNVKSTFICAQSAARAMIASGRRGGKILTLGSIHGVLSADKRLYEGLTVRTTQGRLSALSISL